MRALYGLEDIADRVWHGPQWLRPAAGGILLGGLLLAVPQLYGVGYPVLEHAVGGGYTTWFLLGLLAGKLIATSLTIAIGGSGGVFAPSLFMGAMFGTAYGELAARIDPHLAGPAGAYGLVGMGAVFAGAARAPITAVLIIFELTGDYHIILPLMISIVIATAVASMLSRDSIYTLKLRRRGVDLRHAHPTIMHRLTVADAMRPIPHPVDAQDPLPVLIERLIAASDDGLPVIAGDGSYLGILTTAEVDRAAADNDADAVAGDLAVAAPTLHPSQTLATALNVVLNHDTGDIAVVAADGTPLGLVNHRDVLHAYHRRLLAEHPATATPGEHQGPARGRPDIGEACVQVSNGLPE